MHEFLFSLKIEWAELDTYFTHEVSNTNYVNFGYEELKTFLKNNEYIFSLKEVEYNDKTISSKKSKWNSKNVIQFYHANYNKPAISYIASNKYTNQKIIIREYDLLIFPKFFENWIIEEITYPTSPLHIAEYKLLKKELYYCIEKSKYIFDLTLIELIQLTLDFSEININNYETFDSKKIISNYPLFIKSHKQFFEIKRFLENKITWFRFCQDVQRWFIGIEVDNKFDNSPTLLHINKYLAVSNPFFSLEFRLEANIILSQKLNNLEFFGDYLELDNNQKLLLSTLPNIEFNSKKKLSPQ